MLSSLLIGGDTHPTPKADPREVARKTSTTFATGARTEVESVCLNALRRGLTFSSAGTLAKFVKRDDKDVREALNELVARQLVQWGADTIGSNGYRATTNKTGFNIG